MKTESNITRIVYARLKKIDRFENCRVEAEATVAPGEDPGKVMHRLRAWVEDQVDISVDLAEDD